MKKAVTFLRRLFVLALLAGAIYAASSMPMARLNLAPRQGQDLAAVKSWGYQLQNAAADAIAANIDLLVIDAQHPAATPPRVLTRAEVEKFRTRPDGRPRLVLAYMSIGEAERYRPYWLPHWGAIGPSWLGSENPEWKGNYRIKFWDPGWRRIILKDRETVLDRALERIWPARVPYLDQIIDAGFDGVYLDRVDAYYEWQKELPRAEAAMMAFVAEISSHAKSRRAGFLVVAQNGEELLRNPTYRQHIDAIAKEDLWFGAERGETENKAGDIAASTRLLNLARADRLPVFVVEYIADPAKRAVAIARARGLGYVVHFAERALGMSPETNAEADTQSSPPATAPAVPATPAATPAPARPKG